MFDILLIITIATVVAYIYVKIFEKRSFISWRIERLFWLVRPNRSLKKASDKAFDKEMAQRMAKSDKPYKIDKRLVRFDVKELYMYDMQVFTWQGCPEKQDKTTKGNSDNEKNDNKKRILLYLHGGAYVDNPLPPHFTAANNMACELSAKVYMPIYPKAPRYTYKPAYEKLFSLYRRLLAEVKDSKLISFVGDSAGGGLAIGLTMFIREKKLPQPKEIIAFSPWLDLNCDNRDIKKYENTDPMLAPIALRKMGRLWAGSEENMKKPYLSPIFGNFRRLSRLTMFVGTHEIFYPDVMKLDSMLTAQKIEHNTIVADKMNHAYALFPVPEALDAQKTAVRIIRE